ncbi:hypothetical protein GCM10009718_08620 [Isoptericola halotolerans]|uniref:Carboxypeptidase regulatory-like domain-containing protein n=1 Tax=Isoptericola halotolerans TaxID=300560 RepID=A0ABX2A2W9_9MICO|nr:hypothetical protein [Isoptericola halotolerans]NOV96215.1 hypothetical protein [Isoptericola halotolerans]
MDMTDLDGVVGADDPLDASDVALLERVAELSGRVDPVPEGLVERSRFAMTLAGLESEVMELMVLEAPAGTVRSDAPPLETRTITFTHERLTVMIALSPGDEPRTVRVDGWLAPAETLTVVLRRPDGDHRTTADDDGRFVLENVPRGLASLLVEQDDLPITTPVIEL